MADEMQLRLIRSGVDAWNRWRDESAEKEEYPSIDLIGADLSGLDLSKANLVDADLTNANLTRATLNEADLDSAILTRADLSEVIGLDVRLNEADCSQAKFAEASLPGAHCDGTDFSGPIYERQIWRAPICLRQYLITPTSPKQT